MDKIKPFKSIKNDASITEWKQGENDTSDYVKVLQQRVQELSNIVSQMKTPAQNVDNNWDYSYFSSDKSKYSQKKSKYEQGGRSLSNLLDKYDKQIKRIEQAAEGIYMSSAVREFR